MRTQGSSKAEAESQDSQPQKPTSEQEVAHLAYMAVHGPDTPLSYHDANEALGYSKISLKAAKPLGADGLT